MGVVKIIKEERVFNSYSKIDEAVIQHEIGGVNTRYTREKLNRPDAVTVFLYNKTKDTVILVKQFRYPIYKKLKEHQDEPGNILEVVAGKIDPGENPLQAALREVTEEVGYVIKAKDLIYINHGFASPGYSSERIYQFAAVVKEKDKKKKGGGKDGEFEDIEIVEIPYIQFRAMALNGSLVDMKTRLSYFDVEAIGLFDKPEPKQESFKNRKPLSSGEGETQQTLF